MADTSHLLSHFYVTIAGADAPEDFMRDLFAVTVESSLHLPDVATLMLHDTRLRWIDEARLAPGTTIQVTARADHGSSVLFDGEIVELEPNFERSKQQLVIRAFDRLHRLARGRHVRSFLNVSDGDLVRKIGQEVDLQAEVGPTRQVHSYVLQCNETNLQFLRRRAAALGYLLFVRGKTLHCEALPATGQAVELKWGVTLSEFHPRLATSEQVDAVTVRGWDPASRQAIVGQADHVRGAPRVGETRSGGEVAHQAYNLEAKGLVTDRPIRTQAAADQLAQAVADRMGGRFIEAEGTCSGDPAIIAGVPVRISAVGDRFSGTYCVTRATHLFRAGQGYNTEFSISGHNPATLLSLLTPEPDGVPTASLVIGIVTDNQDPAGDGRVKVKYPWLSGDHTSDWARVAVPGGGAQRGIEFLPEVNDEVLVGFELADVEHAYVLGGLWNGQDAPPTKSNQVVSGGRVQQRIIRSRTGHVITLDDSDGGGGITIQDNNGNKMVLDSTANTVTLQDKNGNKMVLDSTANTATLTATTNVTIDAPIINLGSNSTHPAVLGDALVQYLSQLMIMLQTHVHPSAMGPTGPMPTPLTPPDPSLLSTIVMAK